jgi:hypothetical protein
VALELANPPRRDVAMLQRNGYLVLAVEGDNPGAWLMHCHLGFHGAWGMDLQIVEGARDAVDLVRDGRDPGRLAQMHDTCEKWTRFQDDKKLNQTGMLEIGP